MSKIKRLIQSCSKYVAVPWRDDAEQPAVWVSGFHGSGKSHLVKMLRALRRRCPARQTPHQMGQISWQGCGVRDVVSRLQWRSNQ